MSEKASPLITTIIPTFRRPQLLKTAIESVLNQTVPHFELHIYDNASDDETEMVALEYAKKDSRIFYHRHPENIGAAENFVFGLSQVKTPFFSFLSDDDLLLPDFYQIALAGFNKFPSAYFSCGAVIISDEKGSVLHVAAASWKEQEYYRPPEGLYEMIPKHLDWAGILFRTELRETVGTIDTKVKAIDVDFLLRCAARFPYFVSKRPCGILVQHLGAYSRNAGLKLIYPGWLTIIENIKKDPKVSSEIKARAELLLLKDLKQKLVFQCIQSLKVKKFDEALKITEVLKEHSTKGYFGFFVVRLFKNFSFLTLFLRLALNARRHIIKRKRLLDANFGRFVPFK